MLCVCRWCRKSEWLSSVPTQTASLWTKELNCMRKDLSFILIFICSWKNIIPLPVKPISDAKERCCCCCCCVMYYCMFLCIKGRDGRCTSTLHMCVMHSCSDWFTLLLTLRQSQFTPVSQTWQGRVIGWMFNSSSSNWISFHDKHTLCVCVCHVTVLPSFINLLQIIGCMGHCVANGCLRQAITERKEWSQSGTDGQTWPYRVNLLMLHQLYVILSWIKQMGGGGQSWGCAVCIWGFQIKLYVCVMVGLFLFISFYCLKLRVYCGNVKPNKI